MAAFADILGTLRSALQLGPKTGRLTLSWTGLSAPRTVTFPDAAGEIATFTTNTTSPNATVPVKVLQVVDGATNVDVAVLPKGTGAFVLQIPDGTATGGNKRGARAVDLQTSRTAATQVASGLGSVVAGNNNTASANYTAAVGAGNVSSGSGAFVAGVGNTASGLTSFCAGASNLASGQGAVCFGGSNTVSGQYAAAFGVLCLADGHSSAVFGAYATSSGILGQVAEGHWNLVGPGVYQATRTGLRQQTVGTTPTDLTADAASASVVNQLTLRTRAAYRVEGRVVAIDNATLDTKEWHFLALIKRGASASTTTLVGTPTITSVLGDAATSGWVLAVSADTTNGALKVTVTGAGSNPIQWMCQLQSTEVVGATAVDLYYSSVVLLLHGNGSNGATSTTDSSSYGRSITMSNGAALNTSTKRWGLASIALDGTNDFVSAGTSTDYNFGSGAFTVECWVYLSSVSGQRCIITNYQNSANGWAIQLVSGFLAVNLSGDGVDITGTTLMSVNTWYHVAVSGQSGSIKLFLNGVQEGATFTGAVALNSTSPLLVGQIASSAYLAGFVDDVRVTKGVARYIANFTAPGAEFPDS